MTPQSRTEQLLTESVGDELVVYDERTHEAHRLNPTAAIVWRMADGSRSLPELAASLRQTLAAFPAPEAGVDDNDSEELVRIALSELERAGLLVRGLPAIGEPLTRRKMIAVTAALLPVVTSIVAPRPAMAITVVVPGTAFNGTYNGSGKPGTTNGCGLSAQSVELVVNLNSGGTGTITKTHGMPGYGVTFNLSASWLPSGSGIIVTANGSGGGYATKDTMTFTPGSGSIAQVSGTQNISGPSSCTSVYEFTATRS